MLEPSLVIGGKTSMAIAGAKALRLAADARGFRDAITVVPNRTDAGVDDWQPSMRKFASQTDGFELGELAALYSMPNVFFFSLEFDRLVHTEKTESENLFNVHFSLLPAYKGMATSVWPILEGRSESGVTLHRIDRGIDTGPIIGQRRFDIAPDDTARDLYFNYIRHGTELFESMVGRILDGAYEVTPQPAIGSSYFSKTALDYGSPVSDFTKTAFELRNRIRAFTFPEYQVVTVDGLGVHASFLTKTLSTSAPGTIVAKQRGRRHLATIDYDLIIEGTEIGDPSR